jgi:hypothetical protein
MEMAIVYSSAVQGRGKRVQIEEEEGGALYNNDQLFE